MSDEVEFRKATRIAISLTKGHPDHVLFRVTYKPRDWWALDDVALEAVGQPRWAIWEMPGWKIISRDQIPPLLAAFDAIGKRDRLVFMAGAGR